MDFADLSLALADYRQLFPGAPRSGLSGDALTQWQTAYAAARAAATAGVRITSSSFDGSTTEGKFQFDPRELMRALLIRRAELDPTFDDAVFEAPHIKPRKRKQSYVIRFGPDSYHS